jgi:hypothetical protein
MIRKRADKDKAVGAVFGLMVKGVFSNALTLGPAPSRLPIASYL